MSSANGHASPALLHHFDDIQQQRSCERLGMWMFLVTEVLFFGGLFVSYTLYRMWYPEDFKKASEALNPLIASINTFLLLTSSLTMTLAIRAAQLGQRQALMRNLAITALLGMAFMGFKAYEYSQDVHENLVPGPAFFTEDVQKEWREKGADPLRVQLFLTFYYIMTGIHGVHLVVGIGLVWWLFSLAYRDKLHPDSYTTVEVISLYWHLVDMIWLFLMPLLYLAGNHSWAHLHF